MSYDPLASVEDEPLEIEPETLAALRRFKARDKVALLPGVDTTDERARLSSRLNAVADILLQAVEANPTKRWVMSIFQAALIPLQEEDTEAREHFGMELEDLMDILGIESSDGLLGFYLGGI
jgi:hypothetical protein